MKKIIRYFIPAVILVLIGIQFIPHDIPNPASDPADEIQGRPSYIAPISWMIGYHVSEGREKLNYSEWGRYKTSRQQSRMELTIEQVELGEMPMGPYLLLHPKAKLTAEQQKIITGWAQAEYDRLDAE
ncbi:hypothetical protein CHS0354_006841 [Potamilus streckersoni]|uniref:Haem-binding domain-containing protein n=1 Tax=Potamilus streckersoni TaxID=2493646 RepID=A0AAE0TF65_9BIVA|nr:hypothetical protein CHS0354_006841 [Potamilus streckersoni]